MRKLIFILSSSLLFACSNQSIDGIYKIDIGKSEFDPEVMSDPSMKEVVLELYQKLTYEINDKNLILNMEGMGKFKCTILKFNTPDGVECQLEEKNTKDGMASFGLYKDGSNLHVQEKKNKKIVLVKKQ